MNSDNRLEKMLADGEIGVIEYLYRYSEEELKRAREAGADFISGFEAETALWRSALDAHKNGKKLAVYTGTVPPELLLASGFVPLSLDFIQIKLAHASSYTRRLVLESEKTLPECFCSMDKAMLGMTQLKALGLEPDALVFAASGCDGSRLTYPFVSRALGVPSFEFDIPRQKGSEGIRFIAAQFDTLREFLEKIAGKKQDKEILAACIERTNRSYALLEECAELRKTVPCPLPGRLLVRNGWARALACLPETVRFLEDELETGRRAAASGKSACRGGEKHRAAFVQNMLWSSGEVTDWLEEQYGCACVMDAVGLVPYRFFEHPDDAEDCLRTMAERMRDGLSFHGVSWKGPQIVELADRLFAEYKPDVSVFAGHVGCRHTWAVVRMVSEFIQDQYGITTLELPVDGIDLNYRPTDEMKRALAEYMETVVHN